MPLVGEFHKTYWANSDTNVAPVVAAPVVWSYPGWQRGVVLGSMFGGLVPFFERFWDWLTWLCRTQPRIMRLSHDARFALVKTLDALEHPAYPLARSSVRKTARILGFNRPVAWKDLTGELKGSPGLAENTYRHLEACRLTRANLLNSTLTNPQCHLIVELAYQEFGARGK